MILTADTSVVIPALTSWHQNHDVARSACDGVTTLPAHTVLESVSVLTRLPGGLSLSAKAAVEVVRAKFPDRPLALKNSQYDQLCSLIATGDVRGGQIYDALVGATAAWHGAKLVSMDVRATRVYEAVGVQFDLLIG